MILARSPKLSNHDQGYYIVGRLLSMENQMSLKTKTGVPVVPEVVVRWFQIRDCDSCHQKIIMKPNQAVTTSVFIMELDYMERE